jgi:acyl-homoserine lactone acylase PvdQ
MAYVSSGRLPLRAAGVDPAFPTIGTGQYDWTGFLAPDRHPQAIDPPSGQIVNWNNKPAPGFTSADDNFSYGSVQRVQLLNRRIKTGKRSVGDLVDAMNSAATTDLRGELVWPQISSLLKASPTPNARDAAMQAQLDTWVATGAPRLDANGDGKYDVAGPAIMDAAWPKLADAVLAPVLGSLTERLAALETRDDAPSPTGSAFLDGWYGYVLKDLHGGFANHYCGGGDPTACSRSLWAAIDAAGDELAATQPDPDPIAWREDATKDRIQFAPGFLPATMRWTNRPTYQQILSFDGHR